MYKVQKFVLIVFTMAITSIVLITIGNNAFAIEYTNEKCGVSIQYPEEWEVENQDLKNDKLRSFVEIYPDSDDVFNSISINIWDISDYTKKTIEYVSEIFQPFYNEGEFESHVLLDKIIKIGGFPSQALAYSEKYKEDTTYIMDINILAYDKVYQIELETEDKEKFYDYSPIVSKMAKSIKITEPNFEGINC